MRDFSRKSDKKMSSTADRFAGATRIRVFSWKCEWVESEAKTTMRFPSSVWKSLTVNRRQSDVRYLSHSSEPSWEFQSIKKISTATIFLWDITADIHASRTLARLRPKFPLPISQQKSLTTVVNSLDGESLFFWYIILNSFFFSFFHWRTWTFFGTFSTLFTRLFTLTCDHHTLNVFVGCTTTLECHFAQDIFPIFQFSRIYNSAQSTPSIIRWYTEEIYSSTQMMWIWIWKLKWTLKLAKLCSEVQYRWSLEIKIKN